MKFGLIESLQELSAYILGAAKVPYIYYNESGNWEPYLPKFEKQRTKRDEETSACTVFGTLSQIETLHKFLYGGEPNYAERFTYNLVPIDPSKGTDPQNTHECIRKRGLVDEKYLPMTNTAAEYADASNITGSLLARGLNWLQKHSYQHEWVWNTGHRPENYIAVLKDALKTSPIAVSVSAWNEVNGVFVSNQGSVNNHYCLLYNIDDEGYPWVFDTYDQSRKKLSKDHNIRRAKRIWLNKKTVAALKKHRNILQLILNALMNKKTLLDVCTDALGTDVTPQDAVPDEVACAETVSTLIRKVEPTFPIITGTYTLYEYLDNPKNGWRRVSEYEPETIVVAPTGMGLQGTIGHTWIVMEDGTLASNNSSGVYKGKFTKNYTPALAEKKYTTEKKIPLLLYRKVV